jgi:methionyl-tRNA formyltransferase
MKNYIFFGGKSIGNFVLSKLLDDHIYPTAIVYYRDHLDSELIIRANSLGISIFQIQKFREEVGQIIGFIKEQNPEFFVSVAFQFILPKEILNLVNWPINIHTGAIPKYRGHHPLAAAFLNDEPYQATTVHLMAEEVDAGKILLQDFVQVTNEDDMVSVRQKLIELSYQLLSIVIKQLKNNCLYPKEQIGEIVWAPKRTPEDSLIDFNNKSRYLHNFIRTLVDPYPNAFTSINGNTDDVVKIKKSITSNEIGKVLKKIDDFEYIVSTIDGIIWIKTDKKLNEGDILK